MLNGIHVSEIQFVVSPAVAPKTVVLIVLVPTLAAPEYLMVPKFLPPTDMVDRPVAGPLPLVELISGALYEYNV